MRKMVKEVCIMKKLTLLSLLIPFFCLISNFPVPAHAVDRTPGEVVQGATDPYSVTLYEEKNYAKPFGTWKLAPGMRMLKIPTIGRFPGSILVGSSVSVILFHDWHFSSKFHVIVRCGRMEGSTCINPVFGLVPLTRFQSTSPLMFPNPKYYPYPLRYSLIIHRKDIGDWLGVGLQRGKSANEWQEASYQFYPLPEKASERAIIYPKIPSGTGGPYTLDLMPGGIGQYGPWGSSPNLREIDVTVTAAGGGNKKFPIQNSTSGSYELKEYGISQPSALKIEYKGPFSQSAYVYAARVSAPPAPTHVVAPTAPDSPTAKVGTQSAQRSLAGSGRQIASTAKAASITIYSVSGQWKSNIGLTYTITQQQNNFQWTVMNSSEKGNGTLKGYDVNASWQGPQGGGSSPGKITAVDANGKATKIIWNNGVQFYR